MVKFCDAPLRTRKRKKTTLTPIAETPEPTSLKITTDLSALNFAPIVELPESEITTSENKIKNSKQIKLQDIIKSKKNKPTQKVTEHVTNEIKDDDVSVVTEEIATAKKKSKSKKKVTPTKKEKEKGVLYNYNSFLKCTYHI